MINVSESIQSRIQLEEEDIAHNIEKLTQLNYDMNFCGLDRRHVEYRNITLCIEVMQNEVKNVNFLH